MGLFKKVFSEKIFFTEKKDCKFKLLLSLESKNKNIIISYVDGKNKRRQQITENSLKDYLFIERTTNLFYKTFKEVESSTIIKEMDTSGAGIGGTATDMGAPSSDTYATGDARNMFGSYGKDKKMSMIRRNKITDGINTPKKKAKKKGKKKNVKGK